MSLCFQHLQENRGHRVIMVSWKSEEGFPSRASAANRGTSALVMPLRGFLPLLLLFALSAITPAQLPSVPADELQARIKSAAAARDSGNSQAVARASSQVLSLAFRRLANVRLAQTAFPQAAELYKSSLLWEDAPGLRN